MEQSTAVQSTAKPQSKAKSTMEQSTAVQSTTAVAAKAASGGTLEAYDPDVPSMVVEDNGVIQQEEIYKNWPEQTAAAEESTTMMDTVVDMAKEKAQEYVEENKDEMIESAMDSAKDMLK